jgi:hypothetical protein
MKKGIVYLLLIVNLILSFPVSYIVNVNVNTFKNPDEFKLLVIVCGFIVFIIFSGIAWIVYFVLRKRKSPNAVKIGIYTLTGLTLASGLGSVPEFEKKIKSRNRMLEESQFDDDFVKGCMDSAEGKFGKTTNKEVEDYCYCMLDSISAKYELKEQLMDGSISNEELMNNPEIVKMATDCSKELLK